MAKKIRIGSFFLGSEEPLALILGPCVIEGEDFLLRIAEELCRIVSPLPFSLIFKASYDKANRSNIHSFRGPGLEKGLRMLERVRRETGLPILTDVHTVEEAKAAGDVCDVIQIPAFLCRQTDLLVAAAATPAVVNVKKGQFLAPWDMKNVKEKLISAGKEDFFFTERGTSFGYNTLVTDFRSLAILRSLNVPVCFDASHSVQQPGGLGRESGGEREFIPLLTRAAVAVGIDALFLEVHPDPARAKSDAASVYPLDKLPAFLEQVTRISEITNLVRN
ncbi:MAG: 3-deoxy-8-phosphooctulonate synthase [Verrucomicrobiota bacterium]|nr:3-deoxy-8-phosphooctulonate synthase [Verrucomicrobiota bacterium]